jgi:ADP-heptose:LPS heptosyltransferase
MPRRQRWTPVRGSASRIYDPAERALLGALDLPGRALAALGRLLGGAPKPAPLDPAAVREVLVLRLDRIGDVVMSLPALHDLRAALPQARIRLAVGRWSEEVARRAPVDEVLVWSAPWVGRAQEGAAGFLDLARRARALRADALDLGLDLQGDVRASALLFLSGARRRVGYANTGGAYLLTHVVPLDETVSFVEQNRRAVETALGGGARVAQPPRPLTPADLEVAARVLSEAGLAGRRPRVAIHPSGGRAIKQWPLARWREVATRLQRAFGAAIVFTGSAADRALAAEVAQGLPETAHDLTGRLGVTETMAVIGALDLFLSPDTGPMHLACAVGTPSVSVFGPSDPGRYFSGGTGAPGTRHVVVRADLWCSPCNLIRKPPEECRVDEGPECLRLVTPEAVYQAAARVLVESGFVPLAEGRE